MEEDQNIKKIVEQKGLDKKYVRIDDKDLTKKQLQYLVEQEKKAQEEQERINKFDPRKH